MTTHSSNSSLSYQQDSEAVCQGGALTTSKSVSRCARTNANARSAPSGPLVSSPSESNGAQDHGVEAIRSEAANVLMAAPRAVGSRDLHNVLVIDLTDEPDDIDSAGNEIAVNIVDSDDEEVARRRFFRIVPGEPRPLARHKRGRHGQIYNPSKPHQDAFAQACIGDGNLPLVPLEGALYAKLHFVFQRPLCHYVNNNRNNDLKVTAPVFHTQRPDLDNLVKFVLDALTGPVFADDCTIVQMQLWKIWGAESRTIVDIQEISSLF